MIKMTVTVLTDNFPGTTTGAEHGLSYLVEHDNKRILFDTGQSDLFIKNGTILGINPADTDLIILSHGHYDHGNGLHYLGGQKLICHPGCFVKRYSNNGKKYIGLAESHDEIASRFNLITTTEPYSITDRITFLGEIPRLNRFESQQTGFTFENGEPDFVNDDSAIALKLDNGLFIFTGCGHAGIINTIEYAKKVTGTDSIMGIMGGFHLKYNNDQTKETISYLRRSNAEHIHPSHCTALPALSAFYQAFNIRLITTGEILKL